MFIASTLFFFPSFWPREFADDLMRWARCSTYRSHLLDGRRDSRRVDRGRADGGVLDGAQHEAIAGDHASRDCHILLQKSKRAGLGSICCVKQKSGGGITPTSTSWCSKGSTKGVFLALRCAGGAPERAHVSRDAQLASHETDNDISLSISLQILTFVLSGDSRQRLSTAFLSTPAHSKAPTHPLTYRDCRFLGELGCPLYLPVSFVNCFQITRVNLMLERWSGARKKPSRFVEALLSRDRGCVGLSDY